MNSNLETTQVRLQLVCQDLQCCRLANPVGSHESQYSSHSRRRQAVQLEGVQTVAMCGVLLQIAGKIDNRDGVVGTFLNGPNEDEDSRWLMIKLQKISPSRRYRIRCKGLPRSRLSSTSARPQCTASPSSPRDNSSCTGFHSSSACICQDSRWLSLSHWPGPPYSVFGASPSL